jgi:stalled ribosome rescue protein Dom34
MSNNQQKTGVWMDNNNAYIIAKENEAFAVQARITCDDHDGATYKNDRVEQSKDDQEQKKYFKEIAAQLSNADSIYIVGPGKAQEQFKHFLEDYQNFNLKDVALGSSDHLNEHEMIEKVKHYFGAE